MGIRRVRLASVCPASPSVGYPEDSVPGVSPATNPGALVLPGERGAARRARGRRPVADNSSTVQLLAALRALFGTVLSTAGVPYGIKLGAIYVQWGTYGSDVSEGAGPTSPSPAFPTACQAVFMRRATPAATAPATRGWSSMAAARQASTPSASGVAAAPDRARCMGSTGWPSATEGDVDAIWERNAVGTRPPLPASPQAGFPSKSAPGGRRCRATTGYHMVTQEIRNAIIGAGLDPDASNLEQLSDALLAHFERAAGYGAGPERDDDHVAGPRERAHQPVAQPHRRRDDEHRRGAGTDRPHGEAARNAAVRPGHRQVHRRSPGRRDQSATSWYPRASSSRVRAAARK